MTQTRLIGSAGSLEAVLGLLKSKWSWSVAEAVPTEEPKVFRIASGKGLVDGLRIVQVGSRYRLEMILEV